MTSRKRCESDKALQLCRDRCVVCGWRKQSLKRGSLVVGAHVKPIADIERDSFDDIIALCPNHHAEFDAFMFYIDPETRKIVYMDEENCVQSPVVDIQYVKKEYLAYRQYITEKEQQYGMVTS